MEILIEINSGEESQKAGVLPEDALSLVKEIRELENIQIMGLMTMGPFAGNPEESRPYFQKTRDIYEEIKLYYDMGVRRFSFVDDIFNLDIKNSTRFFKLIIQNRLDIQMFFPSGLRTDILTRDYIDLMVEAGTVSLAMALETASPRLQKLIGKNLDIDKFRESIQYICDKYPGVLSELFTMHGFPTETEPEAVMTLDFIKSLEWVHFPYINILKIYPNTRMEKLALDSGISRQSIIRSEKYYHHEFCLSMQCQEL